MVMTIRPLYLLLGILVVLLFIFFFSDFEKFYPWEPSSMTISQPKPQNSTEEEEEPFIFSERWAEYFQFQDIGKIIRSPQGDIFVVDKGIDERIWKFQVNGNQILNYSHLKLNRISYPYIAIDKDSNLYVVENDKIAKFDSNGISVKTFGPTASLEVCWGIKGIYPSGIAVGSNGNVFAVDARMNCVHRFDSEGNFIGSWTGDVKEPDRRMSLPISPRVITIDSHDNIYLCDTPSNKIQKFDSNGKLLLEFGSFGSDNGQFNNPVDIAVEFYGNIYVADKGNNRIQIFSSEGKWIGKWGKRGIEDGQLISPTSIMIDPEGKAYVASSDSSGKSKIQVFVPSKTK